MAVLALSISLAACGGGDSSKPSEPTGTYEVEILDAKFPAEQRLGQTSLLRLAVRNTSEKTVPALAVTISIAGEEGQTSSLPFGIHDPQPGLAQPDRPVWVLAADYPKRAGDPVAGGTESANLKTFDFGPLKPGAKVDALWKLSAVKTGKFDVLYEVDASLTGTAKAETASGVAPGGSFSVSITSKTPDTIVTDSGEVVEIQEGKKGQKGQR